MRVRTWVVLGLGVLACAGCARQKTTKELIADLNSPGEREQLIAVRLLPLRKADAAQVIPALIDALKTRPGDVRLSAAIGLGSFGAQARDAIPALREAQGDRDARLREAARVAISRIDPTSGPGTPAPGPR